MREEKVMKIAITDEYEAYKDVDYIRILENKDIDRRISIAISSIFIILIVKRHRKFRCYLIIR